ncbi:Aste57867_3132 [Aphanomyces stellatus]|uniref:Aste57867_3132 protein n=1 Tax=Aphanomyces stellatus TaxID=120398 RepID=A0A485K935_9STRA|nr:hypothetical protein As57867_003123 [Aphanomyces stellatus]VFT80308.1 Aste57867_3132 [Aphanomyces stellatus]
MARLRHTPCYNFMTLETANDLGLNEDEFKAGWHFMNGFKRRHRLSLRARSRSGKGSTDEGEAALTEFVSRIQRTVAEHDIDVIFNADQTGINYEYLLTRTPNATADSMVWIKYGGKTKDRATAMLLADSSGNITLAPENTTRHCFVDLIHVAKEERQCSVVEPYLADYISFFDIVLKLF